MRARADDRVSWRAYVDAMATHWTLGCDADDPQRIAAFWALARGYVREPGFGGAVDGRQGPHTWVTMADPEGNEFCVA
jgi:hypothetical protein